MCIRDSKSAIRFEGASGGYSRISNSAVHNGLDWGLLIQNSNNIEIIDNAFVGYRAVGINLSGFRNSTITGNFIGDVVSRKLNVIDSTIDKEACVAYNSYFSAVPTYDVVFKNNIAAGCMYAGFVAPGHACDDDSS